MSLRVEFHELADLDLFEAWTWYEDQQDGLGDRFLRAINTTLRRAARWPNSGEPALRDDNDGIIERKVPADGFPYSVRYRIIGERLVVMAVLHQHRHPNFGNERQP